MEDCEFKSRRSEFKFLKWCNLMVENQLVKLRGAGSTPVTDIFSGIRIVFLLILKKIAYKIYFGFYSGSE
jgi:hypothetical protein